MEFLAAFKFPDQAEPSKKRKYDIVISQSMYFMMSRMIYLFGILLPLLFKRFYSNRNTVLAVLVLITSPNHISISLIFSSFDSMFFIVYITVKPYLFFKVRFVLR